MEGIINIGELRRAFDEVDRNGRTSQVASELIAQARTEWYLPDELIEDPDSDVATG